MEEKLSEALKQAQDAKNSKASSDGPAQEQLQVHIQTIGILVEEKQTLQAKVVQTQKTAQQRLGELP